MSERWTPGPWVVFNAEQIAPADARLGDPAVAIMAVRDEEEQRANARLIASAPELEAALGFLCAEVNNRCTLERLQSYVAKIEPILARARGEESK